MTLSSEVPTDQEQKRDRRPWSYGPEVKYMHNLMGCRGGGTVFRSAPTWPINSSCPSSGLQAAGFSPGPSPLTSRPTWPF